MSIQTRVYHLLSGIVLLSLLLTPLQSLAQPSFAPPPAVGQVGNLSNRTPETGLFRTRVVVRTPADWARLEKPGVVVLEARHGFEHGYTDGGTTSVHPCPNPCRCWRMRGSLRRRLQNTTTDWGKERIS